jgi:hypothetical protein
MRIVHWSIVIVAVAFVVIGVEASPLAEAQTNAEDAAPAGSDAKIEKLQQQRNQLEDKIQEAEWHHSLAKANQKTKEQELATHRARAALNRHRNEANRAEALVTAREARKEKKRVELQGQLDAVDIPDSPDDQINTMEDFEDSISQMTSSLAKAEATTEDISMDSQADDIRDQVRKEMGNIDTEAAEAKTEEQLKLMGKKHNLEVEEDRLRGQISEMQQRENMMEQKEAMTRQTESEEIKLQKQKATEQEQARLETEASKMKGNLDTLESELNGIDRKKTRQVIALQQKIAKYKTKVSAEEMKNEAALEEIRRTTAEKKNLATSELEMMKREDKKDQEIAESKEQEIAKGDEQITGLNAKLHSLQHKANTAAETLLKVTTELEAQHTQNDETKEKLARLKEVLEKVSEEKTQNEIEAAKDSKLLQVAEATVNKQADVTAKANQLKAVLTKARGKDRILKKEKEHELASEDTKKSTLRHEQLKAHEEAKASEAKLEAKRKQEKAKLEVIYAEQQSKLANLNKRTARQVAALDEKAFEANQQVSKLEHTQLIQKERNSAEFERKKAELERDALDKKDSELATAKEQLAQYKAGLREKVHRAQLQEHEVEAQSKQAQERAIAAVEAAKQQTKTRLAEEAAKAEKQEAVERGKMLQEMEAIEAESGAAVQGAEAKAQEALEAAKEAKERARTEAEHAKAEAAQMAKAKIDAIHQQAEEGIEQAKQLAQKAKEGQISKAESSAAQETQKAQAAREKLQEIEDRISKAKKDAKLTNDETDAQLKIRRAQMDAALRKKNGLKSKLKRTRQHLLHLRDERKSILETNDKLRAFMLVYKSNARNLNTDLHREKWGLSNLKKTQEEHTKNIKVARKQAAAARDELYQLKSTLETLERARRNVVANAVAQQQKAAKLKVEQQAAIKREAEARIEEKEAREQMELNKLKAAAAEAASAAKQTTSMYFQA